MPGRRSGSNAIADPSQEAVARKKGERSLEGDGESVFEEGFQ